MSAQACERPDAMESPNGSDRGKTSSSGERRSPLARQLSTRSSLKDSTLGRCLSVSKSVRIGSEAGGDEMTFNRKTRSRNGSMSGGRVSAEVSLRKIVHTFYERVAADPYLADFFKGLDIQHLSKTQTRVIELAFADADDEDSTEMQADWAAHWGKLQESGFSGRHFDHFLKEFEHTYQQLHLPQERAAHPLQVLEKARALL